MVSTKHYMNSQAKDPMKKNDRQRLKPDNPTHDPFASPNLSDTSSQDNDSGNTSGQEEWHLERYSEGLRSSSDALKDGSRLQRIPSKRRREVSPRKRPRPGLNIVTDFSSPTGRAFTDPLIIDYVKSRQPKVEGRPLPSARSQSIEQVHTYVEPTHQNAQAFVDLKDIASTKNKRKVSISRAQQKSKKAGLFAKAKDKSDSGKRAVASNASNGEVPQKGLETYGPLTPSILITPAEETAPWSASNNTGSGPRLRRPASSVYSRATQFDGPFTSSTDAPPIPFVPPSYASASKTTDHNGPRRSVDTWETGWTGRPRAYSDDAPAEGETRNKSRPRSATTESKLAILPLVDESARPASKGWWNLALSPMLSRAGTLISKRSPPVKEKVPPLPSVPNEDRDITPEEDFNEKTPADFISPGTPGRTGMSNPRASTWSEWSSWEREREAADQQVENNAVAAGEQPRDHKVQESSATVPFMMRPSPIAEGLAAEYYHACAVDSRSTEPYFACQNHSCSEKLPRLVSVPRSPDTSQVPQDRELGIGEAKEKQLSAADNIVDNRLRSDSDSTFIEDEPEDDPPVVQTAKTAAVPRAAQIKKSLAKPVVGEQSPEHTPAPAYASPASEAARSFGKSNKAVPPKLKRFPTMADTMSSQRRDAPASPGPLSPEYQQAAAAKGAIPMGEVKQAQPAHTFITINTHYPTPPLQQREAACVALADIGGSSKEQQDIEKRRRGLEKEDAAAKRIGGFWRGRGCVPEHGCFGRGGNAGRKRRRSYILIAIGLLCIVITSVVLATTLTRRGDHTPVESQWLNLTGFPPVPTGISTIIRPDSTNSDSSCINQKSLWSCAVPKEDQASIAPNDPDQPNFRIEIRFRNGTVPANETQILSNSTSTGTASDPFTNDLFTPSPAAPSLAEQTFLGNTTDNNTFPFDGEATPFFITFLPTSPLRPLAFNTSSTSLTRRQTTNRSTSGINFPAPALLPNGSVQPANLLPTEPFPFSQPLRLYNRGLPTEHYGFYTYFDKSIFLTNSTADPENSSGGSPESAATLRCTFSQTRLLVQIWTSPSFPGVLDLQPGTILPINQPLTSNNSSANNSATNFTPPGSFPYPTTLTLDRHGGDAAKKALYCYEFDPLAPATNQLTAPFLVSEFRGAAGQLVNAAPSLIAGVGDGSSGGGFNASEGGVDGGTGGCGCEWTNWVGNGR